MARILVVEDEPNMRRLLLMHLRGEGYSLVETGSVREGLKKDLDGTVKALRIGS